MKAAADPYTVTYRQAVDLTGLSYSTVYRLGRSGAVEVRYSGRKPLIVWASLKAWIDAQPNEHP